MATIKHSLMKSRNPQTLSCILGHLFSIQLLSVCFLNTRVSQLTKRIQDLQKDGDTARLILIF